MDRLPNDEIAEERSWAPGGWRQVQATNLTGARTAAVNRIWRAAAPPELANAGIAEAERRLGGNGVYTRGITCGGCRGGNCEGEAASCTTNSSTGARSAGTGSGREAQREAAERRQREAAERRRLTPIHTQHLWQKWRS